MKRYETDVRDGVLFLEAADGWFEIGDLDDVVELIGGETYVLEYDERQRQVGWLDTDEDGRLTFDVRETIRETTFDEEFVEEVAAAPADETTGEGYPKRAAAFGELLTSIWDGKGKL